MKIESIVNVTVHNRLESPNNKKHPTQSLQYLLNYYFYDCNIFAL